VGAGERSPSKGLRIAVVSAAALLPSATAELRSDTSVCAPFTVTRDTVPANPESIVGQPRG
jgi:hypothetical protein